MNTHERFEAAVAALRQQPCAREPDFEAILARVREFQTIAESPLAFPDRWELVKPFLHWLTTLEPDVAEHVLPLVVREDR